jgi:hypothetical protein
MHDDPEEPGGLLSGGVLAAQETPGIRVELAEGLPGRRWNGQQPPVALLKALPGVSSGGPFHVNTTGPARAAAQPSREI